MTQNCRAALWYDRDVVIERCTLRGIKAVRACRGVRIDGTHIDSPEFGWKSRDVQLNNTDLLSEYAFL